MKQIDNRQNKLIQTKASMKHSWKEAVVRSPHSDASLEAAGIPKGGIVYGLVSNLLFASKIADAAKHCHLMAHNFDTAMPLAEHLKKKIPVLIILDWDGCEAEAYKLLKELRADDQLKKIPVVGYVSQVKGALKAEAQRAGCDRVYSKTEFMKNLDDILMRSAL